MRIIYEESIQNIINGWKDLIKEYERQFEKGYLSIETFNFYKDICNTNLIKLHEIATVYSIMIEKVNKTK